jgi:hypothetical protein
MANLSGSLDLHHSLWQHHRTLRKRFLRIFPTHFWIAHERPKRSGVVGQVRKLSAQIRPHEHDKSPLSCVGKLLDLNVGKPRWICDSRHLRQIELSICRFGWEQNNSNLISIHIHVVAMPYA